jgi:hypothetical protein
MLGLSDKRTVRPRIVGASKENDNDCRMLTAIDLCVDNIEVTSRKAVCLLVLIVVPLASLCLVPFGHGPSSVVDGPRTVFRAYRASLELKCALAATAAILTACVRNLTRFTHSDLDSDPRLASPSLPSLLITLRC